MTTPPRPPQRAVLFDADGVLVDSHAGCASVWDRWSQRHGLDPVVVLAATHARLTRLVDEAPAGVRAGRSAGMRVVGLTTSHPHADLVAAGADVVVGSLTEAAPELLAWTSGQGRWRSAGPS